MKYVIVLILIKLLVVVELIDIAKNTKDIANSTEEIANEMRRARIQRSFNKGGENER